MLKKFLNDEAGAIISAELVLVLTIAVIGMVVGLASVRDAVVTELGDVGQAIANIDQSYTYTGVLGHSSSTAGSAYSDALDFCDSGTIAGEQSRCVTIAGVTTVVNGGDGG
jgi:hypothetical protein